MPHPDGACSLLLAVKCPCEDERLNKAAGAIKDSLQGLPEPTGVGWYWKTNSELE